MKKLALALLVASVAMPALANDPAPTAKKETTAAAPAQAMAAPAAGEAKPMELKDGKWVKINEKGEAMVSKDGKEWAAAPDGTHELKDGAKVKTLHGKVMK